MIRNIERWNSFETNLLKIKNNKKDLEKKFRIMEDLIEHARQIGAWPPKNLLNGLEVDLHIAKVMNAGADKSSY